MKKFDRLVFSTLAAPLLLGLAACGSEDVEASAALDPIEAPAGTAWSEVAEFTAMGGMQMGNPDAPIKLVEYASHTCPACAAWSASAGPLHDYIESGLVSMELRNQVHDPLDLTIATILRCGDPSTAIPLAKQGWSNLQSIVQNAQANGDALAAAMAVEDDSRFLRIAEVSGLLEFFAQRGLSTEQVSQCLVNNPEVPRQIVENSAVQSDELDVTGTPTFFVNGRKLDGSNWATVETALQAAGAR